MPASTGADQPSSTSEKIKVPTRLHAPLLQGIFWKRRCKNVLELYSHRISRVGRNPQGLRVTMHYQLWFVWLVVKGYWCVVALPQNRTDTALVLRSPPAAGTHLRQGPTLVCLPPEYLLSLWCIELGARAPMRLGGSAPGSRCCPRPPVLNHNAGSEMHLGFSFVFTFSFQA